MIYGYARCSTNESKQDINRQLRELKEDLSDVKPGGIDMKIFERDADEQGLLEGSQAFKYNGKYYLMMISMDWGIPGRLRREVCYRADKITGPYEKKVILETPFEDYGGVGQGCIVEGVDGEWYGIIFQDRNGVGRTPCLMPCHFSCVVCLISSHFSAVDCFKPSHFSTTFSFNSAAAALISSQCLTM